MTEPQIGTSLADIKVEMSSTPAAVEQQSTETKPLPELVTTEPSIVLDENQEQPEALEVPLEPQKPSIDDTKNASARQAIEDRIRADNAERKLKELQPKSEVPEKQPDINDKATWGNKYKESPNDLETFLKAHSDWAKEEGKREERSNYSLAEQHKQQMAIKTAVMQKEQEARVKHKDYDSVINPIVPVIQNIPILKDFISKNPMGAEVAYELGRNPAVLETLMRSDVWAAGEQLLNMAARLKAPKAAEITQAPDPIKPVGSRDTVKPKLADLAAKDVSGYIKTMNKQELARKRAN